jgi:hypothetical protein
VDTLTLDPAWTAAVAATLAVIGNLVLAVHAARRGLGAKRTLDAARALVDLHLDAVSSRAYITVHRTTSVGAEAGRLGKLVQELMESITELRALAAMVPEHRARLRSAVLDLLLPTTPERSAS